MEPALLDRSIAAWVADLAQRGSDQRGAAPSLDEDPRQLLQFCRRSAVLALRENTPERCWLAWTALGAVEGARVDPAELRVSVGILDSITDSLGLGREAAFARAREVASAATQRALETYLAEHPTVVPLRDWGYQLVATPLGPGLVRAEYDAYAPSTDLLDLAIRASRELRAEKYPHRAFKVGTSIAPVWIGSREARVAKVLDAATGTALLSLSSEPGRGPQLFNVYFSELASVADAEWLARVAPIDQPGAFATVAFASGRVLCLAVTASTVRGKRSQETWASLDRALEPVRRLMVAEG